MRLVYAFTLTLCLMGFVALQNMVRNVKQVQDEQRAYLESIR